MGGANTLGSTPTALALAGGDVADAVSLPLARPTAMLIDAARRRHFVADTGNGLVRFVDDATGISVILAGNQSSTTLPSTTPVDSRTVSLGRPVGLAVDPVADVLYVADEQRGQILQIESGPGQPSLVSVLLAGPTIQRPGALGVHRFANGQRVLFALDRGTEGTSAPA